LEAANKFVHGHIKGDESRMGFLRKLKKAAQTAGRVGDRMPTTAELIYGTRAKRKRTTKRRQR
jgi:hypothetical protein